jgi:hypothetical protein
VPQGRRPEGPGSGTGGGDDRLQGIGKQAAPRVDGPEGGIEEVGQGGEVGPQVLGQLLEAPAPVPSRGGGIPRLAVMRRCPQLATFRARPRRIISARSQRRSRHNTGSSTCVSRHVLHRERRGRTLTKASPRRSVRRRAWSQGPSSPSQAGQGYSPARSFLSTAASSASTMCIGAPRTAVGRALHGRQTFAEGPCAFTATRGRTARVGSLTGGSRCRRQ